MTRTSRSDQFWRWSLLAAAGAGALGLWRLGEGVGGVAHAERAAFAPACCVASIDLNAVLGALLEKEVREGELKEFIGKQEAALDAIAKQGKQSQEDLRILPVGGPEAEAKAEEIVRLGVKLKGDTELAKALVDNKQKRMHLDLFNKIVEATRRFAEREGHALVVSSDSELKIPSSISGDQVQGAIVGRRIVFASSTIDISQGVSQMMNNEFKAR